MKSKNIIYIAVCCLLTALFSSMAQAKVVARVDRTRLAVDETLTLTISKDSNSFFSSEPDLSPLAKDFTILGQSQSSNTQYINGNKTATATWTLALAPKRAGRVFLPSLTVDKERTQPISLQIDQSAPPATRDDGAPLFVETSLDRKTVFVQSQLLFTVRIFWAVQAQINDPGDPVLEDALLQKLGDATFKKDVNGQQYSVFERRYAIFPQKSGVLEIPSMSVAAVLPVSRRHSSFFDPFSSQGKQVKLRSNSAQVMVIEKPPGYPANAAWLPADSLAVQEQWSHDPLDLKVGDSVTITITTTAKGLLAAQLPPIAIAEVGKFKLYQNKAEKENSKEAGGITGVRKETIALIPTCPGEIQLPEIRIPWWDNQLKKVCYAVTPATRLVIHGTAPVIRNEAAETPKPQAPSLVAKKGNVVVPPLPRSAPLFWIMLCGGLGVAWLSTTLLLLRTRRRHAARGVVVRRSPLPGENVALGGEAAGKELKSACLANNGAAAKSALVAWAKAVWPKQGIRSGADLLKIDSGLADLVEELDSHLYGRDGAGQWNGAELWARVREIQNGVKKNGKGKKVALPSLYNN